MTKIATLGQQIEYEKKYSVEEREEIEKYLYMYYINKSKFNSLDLSGVDVHPITSEMIFELQNPHTDEDVDLYKKICGRYIFAALSSL